MWKQLGIGLMIFGLSSAQAADVASPVKDGLQKSADKKTVLPKIQPKKVLLTGKVVLLRDAFARRGITSFEEQQNQVVLETPQGELVPLISDWRGRAFFQDKNLRDRKVELVGFRRPGVPYFQVLMVYTFDKQGVRQITDYWCDICAIPMYEIKPCDCCQEPIRLRFRPSELPADLRPAAQPRAADRKRPDTEK